MVDLCLRIELLLSTKEQIESKVSFSRRGSIQLAHLVVNPHILSCEDDNRYGMVWYGMEENLMKDKIILLKFPPLTLKQSQAT